jgi:tetraacyldisaccharide 4'-kinase
LSAFSALYGRVASARRAWFERRPHAVHRLPHPVVSVGSLMVGGSGKTPVAALVARILLEHGERPAILSRGYARQERLDGVVVVSDGREVLETAPRAGDEPFMLAKALPGVPVLVCDDRYLAGRLAHQRFGTTVSILDDGFQHLHLARDVDLLLVSPADLDEAVLPAGRLREPLAAALAAHALVVPGSASDGDRVAALLGVGRWFTLQARTGEPASTSLTRDRPVVAVAGIARPERFFDTLIHDGWNVAERIAFPDHHWFTPSDLARVDVTARSADAVAVLTTEKDAARLPGTPPARVPWVTVPLQVSIEPAGEFRDWLRQRVATARVAPQVAGS